MRSRGFLLVLWFALAACVPAVRPAGGVDGSGEQVHLLVDVSGGLWYNAPGSSNALPLSFGAGLREGTLLEAAPDGTGLVVCSDLSLAPIPAGYRGPVGCPKEESVLRRGDSLLAPPQRGAAAVAGFPTVLSPRHTRLLAPRPVLRWTPSAGSGRYTVRVWGEGLEWRAETSGTELAYPEDAPPLRPGVPYRVEVIDERGISSAEEQATLDPSFVLLTDEERAAVQALVDRLPALALNERARQLVEANVYAAHGLTAEAIDRLEPLAGQAAPAVDRRLGELYLQVGLYEQALAAGQQAEQGYHAIGDTLGRAEALATIGAAYHGLGDGASAGQAFEQAIELYESLGDTEAAERLQQSVAGGS